MELNNDSVRNIRHKILDIIHLTNKELKNINVVLELKNLLGMLDDAIDGGDI